MMSFSFGGGAGGQGGDAAGGAPSSFSSGNPPASSAASSSSSTPAFSFSAPVPTPGGAPSSTGGGFGFGAAPATTGAAAPAPSTGEGFEFGAATSTSTGAAAPAPSTGGRVGFGAASAITGATAPATGGGFGFGSTTGAAAPASAPASSTFSFTSASSPAAAPGGAAPSLAPASGGGFGFGAPSTTTATSTAPAPSSGLGLSFPPLGGGGSTAATTSAPAPASGGSSFSFATGGGSTTPAPSTGQLFGGGGGGGAAAPASATGSSFLRGQGVQQKKPTVIVDYRRLYQEIVENPIYFSDVDISDALDQLLESGEPSQRAESSLVQVIRSPSFHQRVMAMFDQDPNQRFFRPCNEKSAQEFEDFIAGRRKLGLLPGWKEVNASELQGGNDLFDGVKALAKFLKLEEARALQILHLYQKDQFCRGSATELNSREYSSQAFHERIRQFYHNQRICFLKNLQEFFRIDQDEGYFRPEVRQAVVSLLDELDTPSSSLCPKLQRAFRSLCEESPPKAQELNPNPSLRYRRSGEWWERQRREWVEQNLMEQGEVLILLLIALTKRVSLGFSEWCHLLGLWHDLRMGALPKEKAYLAKDLMMQRRARRVSNMMALVAIQGLQLGILLPKRVIPKDQHPFVRELQSLSHAPAELEHLFHLLRDSERAQSLPSPELISVVLVFFTYFMHLTSPWLRHSLRQDMQRFWDRGPELHAQLTQRAVYAHLAELVGTLILEGDDVAGLEAAGGVLLADEWARLGFQAVLRRDADRRLKVATENRPEVEAVQIPLADAINVFIAASYSGLPEGPPPLHEESMMTSKKLEFLVFLVASVYHGNRYLTELFWEVVLEGEDRMDDAEGEDRLVAASNGSPASHPLRYLAQEAKERHPVLFFHLICAMVCDPHSAAVAASELSKARLCTVAYDEKVLRRVGDLEYEVDGQFFDPETGISVPPGTWGKMVQAAPGRVPRLMCWEVSIWAAVIRQLEDFSGFLERCHLLPMVDKLDELARSARAGEGLQAVGFNTIIDRCPSLFVYGPCAPRTEDFIKEILRRKPWGVIRYSLRRVEMVLDQLSILLAVDSKKSGHVLQSMSDSMGMTGLNELPISHRLSARLLGLVRVASEAMGPRTEADVAQALVDVQASALNLLSHLGRVDSPIAWRAQSVSALVVEVDEVTMGEERLPLVVWLGRRSLETEKSLNQYRITRDTVMLMQILVENACDASWSGKEMVLPPGLCDDFLIRLVDFATKVLLMLDGWTFARGLDRWLLSLACLSVITTFASRPFAKEEPSTKNLEHYRQSLLERFRHDGMLLQGLLRCIEYIPASALHEKLESGARRRIAYHFLDQLHPEQDENDEDGSRGLFLAPDGILPLGFGQGVGATASREEKDVLERLAASGLQALSLFLKHFLQQDHGSSAADAGTTYSPGALELLTRGAEIRYPTSPIHPMHALSQLSSRRPLVTHIALIASLVLYPSGARVSVAAIETIGLLVRYQQRVRRLRQKEQATALPDWPADMPYPFPPGVMEDILSVTDARGFRRGVCDALTRQSTSGSTIVAVLDLLVNVVRLQPSLAKHLIFFRRKASNTEGEEVQLEQVISSILKKGQSRVQVEMSRRGGQAGGPRMRAAREDGSGMMVLTSVLRFLCITMRRATRQRRFELLAGLEEEVWKVLEWAVTDVEVQDPTEVSVAQVTAYCRNLSIHRYVLEVFALLAAVMVNEEQVGSAGSSTGGGETVRTKAIKEVKAAVSRLGEALLGQGMPREAREKRLKIYMTASFKPEFIEEWSKKASGPKGMINLRQFRLPEWGLMMTDANPKRYGPEGFVYDMKALTRYLHTTGPGAELSESKKGDIERHVRLLNQYYSISAAQHMVNRAFKSMAQVLIAKLRGDSRIGIQAMANAVRGIVVSARSNLNPTTASSSLAMQSLVDPTGRADLTQHDDEWRKERAERIDVTRKMRQPKYEILLTIIDAYGSDMELKEALDTLDFVERSFEQLASEAQDIGDEHWGRQYLQLDIRQCLLTCALLLLRTPALRQAATEDPLPQLGGIVAYAIGSLASLDQLMIDDGETVEPAAPTCRFERLESVLRTCLTLLGFLIAGPAPSPKEAAYQQDTVEAYILQEFKDRRVLSVIIGHWTTASKMAAGAFPALHDYTVSGGARSNEAAEALGNQAVKLALNRLDTIIRFFLTACGASKAFCEELLKEGFVMQLMQDPIIMCLARAVNGGGGGTEVTYGTMEQLLYRRGYRADREESPHYALWDSILRLMGLLLHRLTRPHLGYEAVLTLPPEEQDPALAYANPLTPDEAKVVDEVIGFWRLFSPLLLWPFGEGRILTLGLLREAEGVMALVREMGVHGYSWRTADPQGAEALRAVIKSLVVRTSVALGQAISGEGTPVLIVLADSFAAVSPREVRLLKKWGEWRSTRGPLPPSSENLEEILNDKLATVLAAALAYLRYTGPMRLPKRIPLTPAEARQVVLAEGSRVWYRDEEGFKLIEGIVQRRVREYHVKEAFRLGTYDIIRRDNGMLDRGVRPERIAQVEDKDDVQDGRLEAELELDLPDPSSGVPSYNHGRLSSAHLYVLGLYALGGLKQLPAPSPPSKGGEGGRGGVFSSSIDAEVMEKEEHLNGLLCHSLYMLIMAARAYFRARGTQSKERHLPRFIGYLTNLLWDAVSWHAGQPGSSEDDGSSVTSSASMDVFGESDGGSKAVRERIDAILQKVRQGQELMTGELESALGACFRAKGLSLGFTYYVLNEVRQQGYDVKLGAYAACLRTSSQENKVSKVAELIEDMISDSLPCLLQQLNRYNDSSFDDR